MTVKLLLNVAVTNYYGQLLLSLRFSRKQTLYPRTPRRYRNRFYYYYYYYYKPKIAGPLLMRWLSGCLSADGKARTSATVHFKSAFPLVQTVTVIRQFLCFC